MTIIDAQKFGANKLKEKKIDSAILDAEVLLSHIIKKPKEFLFINPDKKLTATQVVKYKSAISRRAKSEPVAYITGKKEFYGLELSVNGQVLIPRPETEELVEETISLAKNKKLNIVDVGSGSGAIAIALALNLPKAKVLGCDISKTALTIAKKNAKKHHAPVEFIHTDLISGLKDRSIDIITANLPYLPIAEKSLKSLITRSVKYEPALALYSGKHGLDEYKRLFKQIKDRDSIPKTILCEIASTHTTKAKQLAVISFPQHTISIKKDLCGKDRFLIIKKTQK
jgi:release factor glutamine methyltransferase